MDAPIYLYALTFKHSKTHINIYFIKFAFKRREFKKYHKDIHQKEETVEIFQQMKEDRMLIFILFIIYIYILSSFQHKEIIFH